MFSNRLLLARPNWCDRMPYQLTTPSLRAPPKAIHSWSNSNKYINKTYRQCFGSYLPIGANKVQVIVDKKCLIWTKCGGYGHSGRSHCNLCEISAAIRFKIVQPFGNAAAFLRSLSKLQYIVHWHDERWLVIYDCSNKRSDQFSCLPFWLTES